MTITQATKTQVQQWVKRKEQQSPSKCKISSFKTRAVRWAVEQDSVGYLIAALTLPSNQSLAFRCQNRKQTSSKQLIDLLKNDKANDNTRQEMKQFTNEPQPKKNENDNTQQEMKQFLNQLTQDKECHTLTRLCHESQPNERVGNHITIVSTKSSQGGWCVTALDLKKLANAYDTQNKVEGLFEGLLSQDNSARAPGIAMNLLSQPQPDSARAAPASADHNSVPLPNPPQ